MRVVLLELKFTGKKLVYRSVSDLARNHGEEIGIGVGALWNALSKGHGTYENKRCRISYCDVKK